MKRTLFAVAITAFLVFAGSSTAQNHAFTIKGIMVHTKIEGGCWYLDDAGKHYELMGDKEIIDPLHQDGRYVMLRVEPAPHTASICMVGELVKVITVEDTVRHPHDLAIVPMKITGTIKRTKAGVWYVQDANGHKYNYEELPPTAYRKVGTKFDHRVRVLMLPSKVYAGQIIIDGPAPSKKKPAPPKYNNPK